LKKGETLRKKPTKRSGEDDDQDAIEMEDIEVVQKKPAKKKKKQLIIEEDDDQDAIDSSRQPQAKRRKDRDE
jgi:hypothetical protein